MSDSANNTKTFEQMQSWAQDIAHLLNPAARKRITKQIAKKMRLEQQSNIRLQQSPDGKKYKARKNQIRTRKGNIRRNQQMFKKLRLARQMKAISTPEFAIVKITGRAAQIARIHQYGLFANVNKKGPRIKYAQRELLGHNKRSQQIAIDALLDEFK